MLRKLYFKTTKLVNYNNINLSDIIYLFYLPGVSHWHAL